jgi:hypothetical protein
MKTTPSNKRPGVDAGSAFCFHIDAYWPRATQAGPLDQIPRPL